jgi:protocatechuate 3,4-dioxygenase beta subunit
MHRLYLFLFGMLASLILNQPAAVAEIPVAGQVTGPDGMPFPDARVALLPPVDPYREALATAAGESPEAAAAAVTDSSGFYVLDAPGPGIWTVRVEADGFVPLEIGLQPLLARADLPDARLVGDQGLEIKVLGEGGKPLPGAWARLAPASGRRPMFLRSTDWRTAGRLGVTDGEGTLRFPRSAGDRAVLTVAAAGYLVRQHATIHGTALTSRLSRGTGRRVAVLSADGKAAPGALVTGDEGIPLGLTDGEGAVTVQVPGGGLTAAVITEDGRSTTGRIDPPAGEDPEPRRFTLPETIVVHGRVIDADNRRAIADAVVWSPFRPWLAAVTGRNGGFTLAGPEGERRGIVAGAGRYLRSDSMEIGFDADGRPGPTLALSPAAAGEGSVVDGSGAPVAGAEVKLNIKRSASGMMEIRIGGPPDELPGARTDSRGRFRLDPVDPEHNYTLTASAEGFASSKRDVVGLEPRRTVSRVKVELHAGMTVTGMITDPAGSPIPDAEIVLKPGRGGQGGMGHRIIIGGEDTGEELAAWTDTDGRFALTGIAEGSYDMEAVRIGFARLVEKGLEVPESSEAVDLGEFAMIPGEPLQGLVTDNDSQPIEGVQVRAEKAGGEGMMIVMGPGPGPSDDEPDAVTGPDGWFLIDDLEKDAAYNLSFTRAGFVRTSEAAVQVPQVEPLMVSMAASSNVSGTVTGPEGEPVPGATVNMTRTVDGGGGGRIFQMVMRTSSRSDDEGFFLFENVEPGTISLSAVAPGWQEVTIDALEVPKGEDLEDVELPLEPGSILTGQVLAPDGRPAVNARIREVSGKSSPVEFLEDSATTDGDGYYRLEGLAPGEVSVEATHPNHVRVVRDIEIEPGLTDLDFQFEGGQRISGIAVDSGGSTVPGAWIRLVPGGQRWGGPDTLAGQDGSFTFEGVADGDYSLEAEADGYAPFRGTDPVRVEGQPLDGLRVEFDPASAIRGRITGLDPARFTEVRVEAISPESGFRESGVDRQGNYRVENVGPGNFEVTATLGMTGRQASGSVAVEPGAGEVTLDLSFGEGLTLSGRAVMGEEPVKGAMIFAQGLDIRHSGSGRTDNAGEFGLEGLEPGNYRVELRKWETGLSYDETVELTGSREIVLRVPTARVVGNVYDSVDREVLPGVRVELSRAEGEPAGPFPIHSAVTDLNGRFEIGNVPDGSWVLTCNKKGYAAATMDVPVAHGHDREGLRVELDPTEGLALEVRNASGSIPDSVQVAVLDASGKAVTYGNFATGENGRVRMTSVPPGTWDLVLGSAGSAYTRTSASAPGGPVAIVLPQACRLRVEVPELAGSNVVATAVLRDSKGRPFTALGWLGSPRGDFRLGSGTMEVGTLPADTWTVRVFASDGRSWEGSTSTNPGGVNRIVLE